MGPDIEREVTITWKLREAILAPSLLYHSRLYLQVVRELAHVCGGKKAFALTAFQPTAFVADAVLTSSFMWRIKWAERAVVERSDRIENRQFTTCQTHSGMKPSKCVDSTSSCAISAHGSGQFRVTSRSILPACTGGQSLSNSHQNLALLDCPLILELWGRFFALLGLGAES